MHSLARREDLAGKVQMIYIDPPYGIRFASNFQSQVGKRDVKDKETDLTREPEQIKAYRDTWALGVHSYIAYLRDRLLIAKELMSDTASIFIQISDENVHRVRLLMDEIFGAQNFVSQVLYRRGGFQTGEFIANTYDYILWYSKNLSTIKVNRLYIQVVPNEWYSTGDKWLETSNGEQISTRIIENLHNDFRVHSDRSCFSASGGQASGFSINLNGETVGPPLGRGWSTSLEGANRLKLSNRLMIKGRRPRFKPYYDDFPFQHLTNGWFDTVRGGFAGDGKSS